MTVRAVHPFSTSPRKIAVIRALQLGDLLVAVPALRSLRAGFPHAEITLIGLSWAERFVQRFSAYLDRFVELTGYPGLREVPDNAAQTERFLDAQRAYGYDLVIQMHGSGRISTPLAIALGGKVTAGYYEGHRPTGLTVGVPYRGGSEIVRNLNLALMLGCPDLGTELEFPLFAGDRAEAARHLSLLPRAGRPWIGIHPGARASARRWSPKRFAAIADGLMRRHGAQIILTGGPDEREIVAEVRHHMRAEALDLAGCTTLGGLAALIARLDLFVSNDSGPAHLAVAVGASSVVVFGPAEAERWAPLDAARHPVVRREVACGPCGHTDCPIDHRCMEWIAPQEVLSVAGRLLPSSALVGTTPPVSKAPADVGKAVRPSRSCRNTLPTTPCAPPRVITAPLNTPVHERRSHEPS